MPRATVSRETVKRDLNSCPGGWVELRTLSYYEMMHRRDISGRMYQEQSKSKKDSSRQMFEIMNVAVMEYEFKNCIVDHNLEDEKGVLLDFRNSLSFHALDPKIGAEIGRYIDELNQEDTEEDLDSSPSVPSSLSKGGTTRHLESTGTNVSENVEGGSE